MTRWIYTDGAPLLCAVRSARKLWRGVDGSSIGSIKRDYERACEVTDPLGAILGGTSQILVLGDDPAQATFLATPGDPIIARWISCESAELAESVLSQVPDVLVPLQQAIHFQIGEPELSMFDASFNEMMPTEPELMCRIEPGRFEVTTEIYRDGRSFEFWIHRFIRTSA